MPKEILKSRQINIELDEEETAVFREIHQKFGLMPGDIVYAMIVQKLNEYRASGKIVFGPNAAAVTAAPVLDAAKHVERESSGSTKAPTPQQSKSKG